jgi:bifunctional non-homologous end joining protein LigD
LAGAKAAGFLGFVEPLLATLWEKAPARGEWVYEIKYDGYRTQAHLSNGQPAMYTRRGYDWTSKFEPIAKALKRLPARNLILDGEVIVADEQGASDFPKLQADIAGNRTDRLVYYAFDLLYVDGYDLRGCALVDRKRVLAELFTDVHEPIRISEHEPLKGGGAAVFKRACAMRLEGIVCKRADASYQLGRHDSWVKLKCRKSDTYPIIAFVEKLGANPRRIASLYLGRWEDGKLLYAGKARSGYTDTMLRQLRERLDPFIRKTSPLSVPVKKPKATWVEPVVEAEVQFSGITSDGLLREPVFKGIRDDLMDATAPAPAKPRLVRSTHRTSQSHGVPKENILQLLPDAVVPTKEELVGYWRKVHKRALTYLGHRPLKLVRHVHGTTFYHKGPLPPIPEGVHQLKIEKREGGEGTRLWVDSLEGLIGLVEIGAVELHTWNSTVEDIEHPDTLVFDLDPGEGIEWEFVIETALRLRELLINEGLESWPKVTGGKGIHLMVPITPQMTHDAAHRYCHHLAQQLVATNPERYTVSASVPKRRGRLFIDYLRNGRGTTAVATYSPRARAGYPIAAPVTWKQVESGIQPNAFTIHHPRLIRAGKG